ncbi:hypothetical protein [Rhodococcus gannanensis]|uniref:Integral membrane protein n=1 Tax=Rhodococcus gannanensis TaxID=1960308 RepID=A0ABW4P0Q2_9NOCA
MTTAAAESDPSPLIGIATLAAMVVLVVLLVVAAVNPRLRPRILRPLGYTLGGLVGAYAVARGVAEIVTIDVGDPESYRDDWGGPSLAGVLLVHCGPAVIAVIVAWRVVRRRREGHSRTPA